jgi:WD40 repeat protein/serine/threonine protein kinase
MTDRPTSEKSIFQSAIELASAAERTAFLEEACAGDAQLRAAVEELLAAHDRLEAARPTDTAAAPPERPGAAVGPYKLLQQLGEGGMGTVFMAEQSHPVQRRVAVKVIKPGMDSAQVIARFEAERQALALMDHPNIAKVFEAGTTDSGRPYFVMELVKGVPITRYCDERRLTPRKRLELFIPVCRAVQHAHQKGVIHRDLKPSNVLVVRYDGRAVPKVIDFGVAKAAGPKLTEKTLFTEFGAVVGTLEYMSPEQAELNQLDIDTRSDVYSLGVLLYELLTGTTPLERRRTKEVSLLEALRIIREEEPPRPSTRLSTTAELPSIAANRGLEPRKLSGLLRGELDWIVMKALEKERSRRYETADGLARDVERYLADEPVHAGPPSTAYRLRKLLRRHRAAALVVAAVFLLLVSGIIGTTTGLVRALDAEDQAGRSLQKERTANAEKDRTLESLRAQEQQTREASNFYRLALADREWWLNNVAESELVLDGCPEDLRPWEWHYLKRRCHAHLTDLRVAPNRRTVSLRVAASPDLRRVAVAFSSGELTVRDLADGQVALRAATKPGTAVVLAFAPDGNRLAVGGDDLTVWDLTTGKKVFTRNDHTALIGCVGFSADGRYLASGGNDMTARVWDADEGKELFTYRGHKLPITSLRFSPDARHVVSYSRAEEAVWLRETGRAVVTTANTGTGGPPSGPLRSAFSPDGRLFASGDRAGVTRAWDLATGEVVQTFRGHREIDTIVGVAFDAEGRRLATADIVGSVCLHEVAGGSVVLSVSARSDPALAPVGVSQVAFSPDGRGLALGCADRTVKVWSLASWESRILRGATDFINGIVYSSDGTRLAALGPKSVRVWDLTTGQEALTLSEKVPGCNALAFSPDGKQLAASGNNRPVTVWDAATGRPTRTFPAEKGWLHGLEFAPDGGGPSLLLCESARDGQVTHWFLSRREPPGEPGTVVADIGTQRPSEAAASPDGRRIAAGFARGEVSLWTPAGGDDPQSLSGFRSNLSWLTFSADGRRLAGCTFSGGAGKPSGEIKVWDADTGAELRHLKGHTALIKQLAFSPDGALLASAGMDQTVILWDAATGKELHRLHAHADGVSCVAFSPDGKRLVSGGNDKAIKIWETATGREVLTLRGHTSPVSRVRFSPDGSRLASCSLDGTVKIWDGSPWDGKPDTITVTEGEADPRRGGGGR